MSQEENQYLVDTTLANPKYVIKVDRGQRGTYGWEIRVSGNNKSEILLDIKDLDNELRKQYG